MYAVIDTGGKQARVEEGSVLAVERVKADVGSTVDLRVIFIADGDRILATADQVAGAAVTAEVLEHFKGEKQIVFKFKKRKGYKRTTGHRQQLTSVRIVSIVAEGAEKPVKATKAEAPKAKKAEKAAPAEAPKKAEKVEKAEAAKPAKAEKAAPVKAEAPKPKKAEKAAPAEAPKKAAPAEAGMCAATKSDGTPCTNKAKEGSKYCGVHAKKYDG
ncbi:MAG: 50S ribosomal protein L21 [Coriobacteriia bacterium]|nr:50S ribosomal protein L21 [Coriobacteriia bacterium]